MNNLFKIFISVFVTASVLVIFNSCGNEKKTEAHFDYFTNYDQYLGFLPDDIRVIKSTVAHSGNFVSKMDTVFPYSLGLVRKWGELTAAHIQQIDVNCWVYPTQVNQPIYIICSYDYPGNPKPVYYEFYDAIKNLPKANEWQQVTATFYLPDTIDPNLTFKMFLWNKAIEPAYVDDFGVQFVEKKK